MVLVAGKERDNRKLLTLHARVEGSCEIAGYAKIK